MIFVLPEAVHRTLDKGGEDLLGAVLLHGQLFWRWSYYLSEGPELWTREERISIVQSFFMENSCRWSYYLREGPELWTREERISIVQSFFMENSCRWCYYLGYLGKAQNSLWRGKDLHSAIFLPGELLQVVLLPKGRPRTLYEREDDLHSAILLQGELLKVILLPEGGSGTVDKGGEDLHCAVFLHGELLQVV
jgi:hypothetical protein